MPNQINKESLAKETDFQLYEEPRRRGPEYLDSGQNKDHFVSPKWERPRGAENLPALIKPISKGYYADRTDSQLFELINESRNQISIDAITEQNSLEPAIREMMAEVVRRHARAVYVFARGKYFSDEDSREISNEVFLRFCRMERLRYINAQLRTFLLGMALNISRELWSRERKYPSGAESPEDTTEDGSQNDGDNIGPSRPRRPEETIESNQLKEAIMRCFFCLTRNQQQAILLSDDFVAIHDIGGIPANVLQEIANIGERTRNALHHSKTLGKEAWKKCVKMRMGQNP